MLYSRSVHLMTSRAKTSNYPRTLPRAILFDMDGTLLVPDLDYPRIKAEMGIGPGPILESLAELDNVRRQKAQAVLHRIEETSAQNSRLNDGCLDLLAWLAANGLTTALITRNSRLSAQTVFRLHQLSMDVIITREDGPFKPSPIPLELACRRLGVKHDEAWMVGDGEHDIAAARAAGIRAVWISHDKPKTFDAEPWLTVNDLIELSGILKQLRKS
jgi:HAD superfamily hydrolase (TIGR01509 family)